MHPPITFYLLQTTFHKKNFHHAHGRRQRGQGGVHQVVDEIIVICHVTHHFGLVFFDGELIENDFKHLRDMLETMVDVNIKDKEEFIM